MIIFPISDPVAESLIACYKKPFIMTARALLIKTFSYLEHFITEDMIAVLQEQRSQPRRWQALVENPMLENIKVQITHFQVSFPYLARFEPLTKEIMFMKQTQIWKGLR